MVPSDSESSSSGTRARGEPATLRRGQETGCFFSCTARPGSELCHCRRADCRGGMLVAGEKILDAYHNDLFPPIKINPTIEEMSRLKAARLYSATLTFTSLGGFLGLTMGLAGGLARRSVPAGIPAAMLGFVLGAAVESITGLPGCVDVLQTVRPDSGRPGTPLAHSRHDLLAVGAIGGLAFGLGLGGRGRWRSTLVGGLLGAAVATVVYEIGGALVFASSKTELPLSSSVTTRAIALLLVAICSAVGAAWATNSAVRAKESAPVPS